MEHSVDHNTTEIAKPNVGHIWRTFWIMAAITAVEFVIAFTMPSSLLKVSIFVGLTIVKAFYIVAEFMHLKYEVKSLIYSKGKFSKVLVPMSKKKLIMLMSIQKDNTLIKKIPSAQN
jgi:cytochrome c oxidase subunit IV